MSIVARRLNPTMQRAGEELPNGYLTVDGLALNKAAEEQRAGDGDVDPGLERAVQRSHPRWRASRYAQRRRVNLSR